MPNRYAKDRFEDGKSTALWALIQALEEEKLPRERGYFLKTGQIEKYLDLESPLQPRTLLAVLRDAKVPHDNNWRFRPLAIYERLPNLWDLPRQYFRGELPDSPQVNEEAAPGMEETGNGEEETGQGRGEERVAEAGAETRIGPPETKDKPEVETGQGAVARPKRRDRMTVTFEGISTLGERIVSLSPLGRSIRTYAIDMGLTSSGRRRYKRIGTERPPLLTTME